MSSKNKVYELKSDVKFTNMIPAGLMFEYCVIRSLLGAVLVNLQTIDYNSDYKSALLPSNVISN